MKFNRCERRRRERENFYQCFILLQILCKSAFSLPSLRKRNATHVVFFTLSKMRVFARPSPTQYETDMRAPKARARKFWDI